MGVRPDKNRVGTHDLSTRPRPRDGPRGKGPLTLVNFDVEQKEFTGPLSHSGFYLSHSSSLSGLVGVERTEITQEIFK